MFVAQPPASSAWRAILSAGNFSMSGFSKVSLPALARSSPRPVSFALAGQERQWAIGVRMSGGHRGDHGAVPEGDDAVNDRLRMNQDVEAVVADPEKMMRLNQFQALVHQGRGIDADLRTHRPVGMLDRLLGPRAGHRLLRPVAERSAGRGKDNLFDVVDLVVAERLNTALCSNPVARSSRPHRGPRQRKVRPRRPGTPC